MDYADRFDLPFTESEYYDQARRWETAAFQALDLYLLDPGAPGIEAHLVQFHQTLAIAIERYEAANCPVTAEELRKVLHTSFTPVVF